MSKLKVLQVTHDLNVGGLQKLVVDIALNIDREKFEIAVCCLRDIGPMADLLQKASIPIYEMNQITDGKTDYFSFMNLYWLLKELKIDVIHTHNTNPFVDGGLAAIMARTPVRIHTDHAREFPDKKRYMIAEKVLSYFYDEVVAVSEQTKADLVHYEKISADKIKVIQNGVAIPKSISNTQNEIRSKFVVGAIGRLCEAKGYEYLIRAMSIVRKTTPDVELQIVGDGELMQSLSALVEQHDLGQYVKLVGESSDVAAFYDKFDVFVISSIREGLPLVLLEAMAAKVAIITTDVGGIPNVVEDRETALMMPARDENVIAEKILYAMNHKDEVAKLSNAAFDVYEKNYSIGSMMAKYESLYDQRYLPN